MDRFLRAYKVHLVAWVRLIGALIGIIAVLCLFGLVSNILFKTSVDLSPVTRLGVFLAGLVIVLPPVTAKIFPDAFEIEE